MVEAMARKLVSSRKHLYIVAGDSLLERQLEKAGVIVAWPWCLKIPQKSKYASVLQKIIEAERKAREGVKLRRGVKHECTHHGAQEWTFREWV